MFIRVKIDGEQVILVNHNCGVRLLVEYLRLKTQISDRFEIDLCHHCGYLTKLHTLNPTLNGVKFLKNRTLYYVVKYQRTGSSGLSGGITHIPVPVVGNNQRLAVQILGQVRKNKGYCKCLGEPSLIEFTFEGTEIKFKTKDDRYVRRSEFSSNRARSSERKTLSERSTKRAVTSIAKSFSK